MRLSLPFAGGMRLPGAGRRMVPALACGFALATLWAGAATWYLVFHDEVLARFVSQQSALQYGYEERIGALRLQLDRAAMEHLATREGVTARVADLSQRQAAMEKRQAQLSLLATEAGRPVAAAGPFEGDYPAETGALGYASPEKPAAKPFIKPMPKPFPTPDALELRSRDSDGIADPGRQSMREAEQVLAGLERRVDSLGADQIRTLDGLGVRAIRGSQRLRDIVIRVGLDPQRFERQREAGIGGPLVPLATDPFGIAVGQVQRALGEEERLRRIASALPVRRPLSGDYTLSSSFGPRLDPLTRGLAMHTGLDMKAEFGEVARVTAAGRVTIADYNGGYGNMVEVDHGNGLATRYAHLSSVSVGTGQWVDAGAPIGRVGSTGRSTGTHLHYETRIDGEPVDPQRFLRVLSGADARLLAAR
ncbi:M23 family metallopeptidase [Methylobacterium sp. 77]|uniref:M23 family metallopeptidase n=1 Tax=Methylobacterium sp. 77 TaxID=1101192 RepID=UPI00037BF717|nr:M23 family metallopeptidase [Methylobacterium sp. 77]